MSKDLIEELIEKIEKGEISIAELLRKATIVGMEDMGHKKDYKEGDKDDCVCFNCKMKKLLEDESFWKSKECKESSTFRVVEEELQKMFGVDLDKWLAALTTSKARIERSRKDFMKNIELGMVTKQVCLESIKSIMKSEEKTK